MRLQAELKNINRVIDSKIMRGMNYAAEARKHKMLIAKLYKMEKPVTRNSNSSIFSFFNHAFS